MQKKENDFDGFNRLSESQAEFSLYCISHTRA